MQPFFLEQIKRFPARFIIFTGLVFLLIAWLFSSAAAQSEPLPIEAFWQRIADTQAWLQTNPAPAAWATQADQWSAVKVVQLPDGSLTPVDTHEIVALLRAGPPDKGRLNDYLTALLQARADWSKTGEAASELAALQAVLSRPEFQAENENFLQRLYRQVMEFLQNLLNKLFPRNSQVSLPLPPWLAALLAVLLLGGILAFVFRDVWRNILPENRTDEGMAGDQQILTASQASQRARQLSSGGDYRQAIRYLYLSALLQLDERGLLRYNRSLTNREYLRQVANQTLLASHLRPVIDTFDRVWYGFQPIDEHSYTQYTEQVAELEETKE